MNARRNAEDAKLVRDAKLDSSKFEAIVLKYDTLVRWKLGGLRMPDQVDDLVQRTWLQAWQGLESFQGPRLGPWLCKIAWNAGLDVLRKAKAKDEQQIPESLTLKEISDKRSNEAFNKLLVRELLLQVTPKMARMIVEYHLLGKTQAELSEIHGMPENTIKVKLFRARKTIREKSRRWSASNEARKNRR